MNITLSWRSGGWSPPVKSRGKPLSARTQVAPLFTGGLHPPLLHDSVMLISGRSHTPGAYLFRSSNQGVSWQRCNTGLPSNDTSISLQRVFSVGAGKIVLHAAIPAGKQPRLYLSTDTGITWTNVAADSAFLTLWTNGNALYGLGTSRAVLKSTDDGATWEECVRFGPDLIDLIFVDSLSMLARAKNGAPFARSSDRGETWSSIPPISLESEGGSSTLRSLPLPSPVLFADSWKTSDAGRSWEFWNPDTAYNLKSFLAAHPGDALRAFVHAREITTSKDTVLETNDAGKSWTVSTVPVVNTLLIAPSAPENMYGLKATPGIFPDLYFFHWTLFLSHDGGKSWRPSPAFAGQPGHVVSDSGVTAAQTIPVITDLVLMGVSPTDANEILFHKYWEQSEPPLSWENMHKSLGGPTPIDWTRPATWKKTMTDCIQIAYSPTGDTVIALTKSVLQFSTDRGDHWAEMTMVDGLVRIAVDWNGRKLFVASRTYGVLSSYDFGSSWIQMNRGLYFTSVNDLLLDATGVLYAATSEGIYRLNTTVGVETISTSTTAAPVLDQNYPNPTYGITHISFSIADASHVSLDILDILGRKVRTLYHGRPGTGKHHIGFDASRLAAGAYICRLTWRDHIVNRILVVQ